MFLSVIFVLIFESILNTHSAIIETECEIVDSHPYFRRCTPKPISCTLTDFTAKENDFIQIINLNEQEFNKIVFDDVDIHTFPTELFSQCQKVDTIEMRAVNLIKIKDHSFDNATNLIELDFGGNNLEEITAYTFYGARKLTHLDLYRNQISKISSKAFDNCESIEYLDISFNKITSIDPDLLTPLKNLTFLQLYKTKIVSVSPKTFYSNKKLNYIDLESTELKGTVELEFDSVKLHILYLNRNEIEILKLRSTSNSTIRSMKLWNNSLTSITFDSNINVRDLHLHNNKFESIPNIPQANAVITLDLENNPIKNVSPDELRVFSSLKSLTLGSMNLQSLKSGYFSQLSNLQELSLRNNTITKLDVQWFTGLSNLKSLDLEGNKLDSIDYQQLTSTLKSLKTLGISDNLFNCTFLKEMIDYLKDVKNIKLSETPEYDLEPVDHSDEYEITYVSGITCVVQKKSKLWAYIIVVAIIIIFVVIVIAFLNLKYGIGQKFFKVSYRSHSNLGSGAE